jgi:hypothetical protein
MPAVAWTATLKKMPRNQVACTNALDRERQLDNFLAEDAIEARIVSEPRRSPANLAILAMRMTCTG